MFKVLSQLITYLLCIIIVIFSIIYDNSNYILISTFICILFCLLISKLSPANPLIWYVFFINLYHLSIIYLHYKNIRFVNNPDDIILANFIATIGFLSSNFLFLNKKEIFNSSVTIKLKKRTIILYYYFSLLLTLIIPLSFINSNSVTKSEFDNNLGSFYGFLNLTILLYLIYKKKIGSTYPKLFIIFNFSYLILSTLILGERNIIISFMVIIIISGYSIWSFSRKKIAILFVTILLAIPILGEYKNLFTRTTFDSSSSQIPMLEKLADGEFRSAGYNLDKIFDFTPPLKYGTSLLNDIGRALVPGFIYKFDNSISWYNNEYNPEIVAQGRGYGFSLAAEGYINFSWAGIFLWFFIMGVFINYLYYSSMKSTNFLIIYILMIPFLIYALRGDFSSIFSPLIKQILLPLFIIYLTDKYTFKKKR
ncbi:O-antigen polymerase [Moellerella wisconsensis]|uniref:Oligosaccharide repeat unit polymerase n=1 Tax=Moellerella wisconsensis TaxID=158849 RepID=A0ACD3Y5F5_9GAMM|nr:O-antigen polymerase [Moellerella wisconsensis]UNH38215.1 oligosaccharide repeat unit polymerase [Moellerella wisconsensis]